MGKNDEFQTVTVIVYMKLLVRSTRCVFYIYIECVCVCVQMYVSDCACINKKSVYLHMRERQRVCVCVCERERERVCESVCVLDSIFKSSSEICLLIFPKYTLVLGKITHTHN